MLHVEHTSRSGSQQSQELSGSVTEVNLRYQRRLGDTGSRSKTAGMQLEYDGHLRIDHGNRAQIVVLYSDRVIKNDAWRSEQEGGS